MSIELFDDDFWNRTHQRLTAWPEWKHNAASAGLLTPCDTGPKATDERAALREMEWEINDAYFPTDELWNLEKGELLAILNKFQNLMRDLNEAKETAILRREWNILKSRISSRLNEIHQALRVYNIEQKRKTGTSGIGDRMLRLAIGALREAGWTVEPPKGTKK